MTSKIVFVRDDSGDYRVYVTGPVAKMEVEYILAEIEYEDWIASEVLLDEWSELPRKIKKVIKEM